jgi:cephalosporin-C deacetylase-like acetyl esterase
MTANATAKELEAYAPNVHFYDAKDQLKQFVYKRSEEAFAQGDAGRDAIQTIQELEERQKYVREKFIECIGGLPCADTPLNPRITGVLQFDGFRIEKVIYESRPGTFVTANLYIPDGITQPRGAVLFLCGHFEKAKHVEEYQIVCRYLVGTGLVVLSQDPVGQGERFSYYEAATGDTTVDCSVEEHNYAGSQCWPLGDALARYFLHDAMRGIDYLCSRPEVDPKKIGVTGNSGGGVQAVLLMLSDPRIAAAAPATFVMSRQTYLYAGQAQDSEQIWPRFTALGFDHEDILLAMVPRPVLALAVTWDFFPIEGVRRTVERTRRFWELYGKSSYIDLVEDDSDHHYTRRMAKATAEFLSYHLLGEKVTPPEEGIQAIEPSKLWCTETGQVRGEIAEARAVFDENCARLCEVEKQRHALQGSDYKERALNWLNQRVYKDRQPCDLNPRYYQVRKVNDLIAKHSIWWSQKDLLNNGVIFRDHRFKDAKTALSIGIWDGGTARLQDHMTWIREKCASGQSVMVLDVSGIGNITPATVTSCGPQDFYGAIFKLAHDLFWLDDSIVALRAYDIIRAVDVAHLFKDIDYSNIEIYACGLYGVYAKMATVLDKRIKHIETINCFESYAKWIASRYYDQYDIMSIVLPDALKYFDLPDLDKWILER